MKKLIDTHDFEARDPFVTKIKDKYYRCYTDDFVLYMSCASTIDGLSTAEGKVVYTPDKSHGNNLWAPELHVIDGKFYVYITGDDGDEGHHRMYCLENATDDPMNPYVLKGKVADETDKYAIDGNILHHNGNMYLTWSGREGDVSGCQKLYIAKMKSPWELDSPRVQISTPEYDWEKLGGTGKPGKSYINEGPFAFKAEGKQYLAYSAAGSWCEHYCIAMMELVGEDPLDPKSWKKFPEPVFCTNELVKGAGHCSLLCEEDKIYVFFHAWDKDEETIKWNTVATWYGEMKLENGKFTVV